MEIPNNIKIGTAVWTTNSTFGYIYLKGVKTEY